VVSSGLQVVAVIPVNHIIVNGDLDGLDDFDLDVPDLLDDFDDFGLCIYNLFLFLQHIDFLCPLPFTSPR
jgi:hypothetical protein